MNKPCIYIKTFKDGSKEYFVATSFSQVLDANSEVENHLLTSVKKFEFKLTVDAMRSLCPKESDQ